MPPAPAPARWRRGGRSPPRLLQRALLVAAFSAAALIVLILLQHRHGPKPPNPSAASRARDSSDELLDDSPPAERDPEAGGSAVAADGSTCATVERMGEEAAGAGRGSPEQASLRVREMIRRHFELHGIELGTSLNSQEAADRLAMSKRAERVRTLPAHEFCKQGFVLGKASEAGFGNEMYKILTAGALSVMLNRSLIIGQTRGLYPFGEYISYTNQTFTIHEIKHLWRKHRCARTYGRDLNIRVDIFENPAETNVLCSDWNNWKDPIIWFDGATDAVGIQFFLKNVHPRMKASASALFGLPDSLYARPNTFGELMRAIISPSIKVQEAVDWALKGANPDIVLHTRMMANRPVRARKAAVLCIKRAVQISHIKGTPLVALVSDTPAFVKEIKSDISEFAEVLYFDYKLFAKTSGLEIAGNDKPLDFRSRDWGSAPRWVAFVDFFVAAQARYAVVTGAHRRVGTTYAQLIAALAAANRHGQEPSGTNFTFLSSVHSNLLVEGLSTQVGWGHIWNRYTGPLSCQHQPHQCALTPLLPPAWWDGQWQSPIPRDVRRLLEYGVRLSNTGEVDERRLVSYCRSRKDHVKRLDSTEFSVVSSSEDQVELSFRSTYNPSHQNSIRLNIDKRLVMLRGSSGFYCYAIFEHDRAYPALNITEARLVFKLNTAKFNYMAITDHIQRYMPSAVDREEPRAVPLAYKEAVLLVDPKEPQFRGEVDDKYQYSLDNKDNVVHGWISGSDPNPIGFWVITPSNEFKSGGPLKRELTSHVGPTSLTMFMGTHYVGKYMVVNIDEGEEWKKVLGPVFIYLNSGPSRGDLWEDAKAQARAEARTWPYGFLASPDFPKTAERGSVTGRLLVRDRYLSKKHDIPAGASAYVGLASPGQPGSWATESKAYQFWTRAASDGTFSIANVRAGVYDLYAFVPGVLGDYRRNDGSLLTVAPGRAVAVGDLVFEPPRSGPTLWEIGVPDRTAAEFYVPDPDPRYVNRLFVDGKNGPFPS